MSGPGGIVRRGPIEEALGRWLIEKGLVGLDVVEEALQIPGGPAGFVGAMSARVSERDVYAGLAETSSLPLMQLEYFQPDSAAREVLPESLCRDNRILPLFLVGSELTIATDAPWDDQALERIRFKTECKVFPVLMAPTELAAGLDRQFASEPAPRADSVRIRIVEEPQEQANAAALSDDATVVRMVNALLEEAIRMRASDIHLEPQESKLRVRYRIDGLLMDRPPILRRVASYVVSRIKVLSGLDITVKRQPQDGDLNVVVGSRNVDLRISTFPTVYGEKVVLRIMESQGLDSTIDRLGLPEEIEKDARNLLKGSKGLFLATGPTGSGKSTTLYAMLKELNDPRMNIVTLENPVELRVEGITQGSTNPRFGFSFASGLRSILRQDPDIVMVGEIRDLETLEIAVQAALTGHLVLSTLHTNGTSPTIHRLLQMGLEPYLIADALTGVIAQRLVRRVCDGCAETVRLDPVHRDLFECEGLWRPDLSVRRGRGCSACHGTGYFGRAAVFEYLRISPSIQSKVLARASLAELQSAARDEGLRSLRWDALQKALQGVTTVDEVLRTLPA